MQQVVRLLGDLGERYGAEHVYHNLRTPADAIKLLCINHPEFRNELLVAHEKGIGYRVLQAGVDLKLDELELPIGRNDLVIAPVMTGSDFGDVGNFLLGAALIGVALINPFGAAAIGTFGGTPILVNTAVATIGATMVLGGITQMLSPQPELPNGGVSTRGEFQATRPESVNRGADGQQSYAYLGAQNTVGVGATIPVAYGKVLIGSHVISADVDVADESDPIKKATRTPGPDTVMLNGDKLEFGTRRNNSARWNTLRYLNNRSFALNDRFVNPSKDDKKTATNNFRLEFTEGPTKDPNEYFVFLELNKLFNFVSGPGSTKTDGFISYMIESRRQGTNDIHARESFTIQGLVLERYRWYHKFNPNKAPHIDFYNLDVTILDASVDSSVVFVFRHGFRPSIT